MRFRTISFFSTKWSASVRVRKVRKVRKTIHELGGTMPENLPVAENIKKVESREKKRLKVEEKKALQPPPEGNAL